VRYRGHFWVRLPRRVRCCGITTLLKSGLVRLGMTKRVTALQPAVSTFGRSTEMSSLMAPPEDAQENSSDNRRKMIPRRVRLVGIYHDVAKFGQVSRCT
jgi:Tfp pilus assembly protein PilO